MSPVFKGLTLNYYLGCCLFHNLKERKLVQPLRPHMGTFWGSHALQNGLPPLENLKISCLFQYTILRDSFHFIFNFKGCSYRGAENVRLFVKRLQVCGKTKKNRRGGKSFQSYVPSFRISPHGDLRY